MRFLRAALATALLVAVLAGCGSSSQRPRLGAGPNVGAPINLADCHDWNQATTEERLGTLAQLKNFAGGIIPGGSATVPSGVGAVLDDKKAYDLLNAACKPTFAQGFQLYKLYQRAAAFAGEPAQANFGRSGKFGLIGVFVVAAVVVVIALTADSSDPNPKLQYGLIFGVVGVFFFTLLLLQRGDLNRASAGDERSSAKGRQEIADPTGLDDGELWAALAVKPIDDDAVEARREMWGAGRRSIGLAALIGVLIFLTVPSIYLFDTFVPLLIGAPLIVIAALYGSWRAIGPGGEVDNAYVLLDRSMKPLGLGVDERPDVQMVPRAPSMPGYSARLIGPLVMTGERHGRRVEVRQEQDRSEVALRAKVPRFDATVKRGRFVADEGSSLPALFGSLSASDRWKGVEIHAGATEILVQRKGSLEAWLCDLWLAERVAQKT